MAEAFGKQLLDEVEVVGFGELIFGLQRKQKTQRRWLGCAQIDNIISTIRESSTTEPKHDPPIIEITSTASGAGKTHLLYLLTALAALPERYGGHNAAVVIIDADNRFEIDRLAQHIRHRLQTFRSGLNRRESNMIIKTALYHVHIVKPKSMSDLVQIIHSLPGYFFLGKHFSIDRHLGLIAIDSASAFHAETKAQEENAAFDASISSANLSSPIPDTETKPVVTYADLEKAILVVSKKLQGPVIFTSKHVGAVPKSFPGTMPQILRPSLPPAMWQLSTLRLIVRRVPVKKLPASMSVTEALRESVDRAKVVSAGRFECTVNQFGLNARTIQALRESEDGFFFRIKSEGLTMEKTMQQKREDEEMLL